MCAMTYPCRNYSWTMLEIGTRGSQIHSVNVATIGPGDALAPSAMQYPQTNIAPNIQNCG